MKKFAQYFFSAIWLILLFNKANGQAPVISYSTPTNIYTTTVAIANLTPINAGGAVPATTYGVVTTLVATGAGLVNPQALAADGAGNTYIADANNNLIRKVTAAGVMTTLAGSTSGEVDGTGVAAKFNSPDGICYDGLGNLYVADAGGHTIRKIVIATKVVTTFAGVANSSGTTNSTLLLSKFNGPAGLDYDTSTGNIFVCDQGNQTIRMISGGNVTTLAGTAGSAGSSNVAPVTFNSPNDLVADGLGNVYVADYLNSQVRKIVISTGVTTTFAGSTAGYVDATGVAAKFNRLGGIAADASGNLYIADLSNNRIRVINPAGVVTTVAGSGASSEVDGTGTAATIYSPAGIDVDNQGNCYVLDFQSGTTGSVRKIIVTGYTILPTALPVGLTFTGTTGVISGTPTTVTAATNYTITGWNATGGSSTVISIAVGKTVNWLGFTNATWATVTNWNTGAAPGVNDAVTIGVNPYTGAKKEPIITTAVTVGSITFGNSLGNHTLTVTSPGSLTVASSFNVPTGITPTVTGTGNINISPAATVNITGTGVLTTALTLGGKFTLMSDATGSATLGQILTTSIVITVLTDSIHVQRYLTGGAGYRGYRLLSSPMYTATVAGNNVCDLHYLFNGIYVTGAAGGGFSKTGNPSIYLFREDQSVNNQTFTTGNFWGISKMNNALTYNYFTNGGSTPTYISPGNGYMVFFRGDKSVPVATETVAGYVPVAATLEAWGTLNAGQIIVHDWYTQASANLGWTNVTTNGPVRGYNLVGNPYASSIDWEQYNTTTSTTGIYVQNVGTTIYELNPATGNYDSYQVGGAFTNHGSRTIVSGQAFFVIATAATAQLNFNESAKASLPYTQNTGLNLFMADKTTVQSLNNTAINQHLRLQLSKDSINTDDTYIGFSSSAETEYVYNEDAPYKPGNGQVGLASISSDNVPLAINRMPLGQKQIIKLQINAVADGTYKLKMLEISAVPKICDIWLMDAYKKDSLDIRHNSTYTFDIKKSDTNSYGSSRFSLVIRQNAAVALHLLSFTAAKATNGAQITWTTENEQNYTNFTVERSADNSKTFEVLGGFLSSAAGTYSFLDKNPIQTTTDWYRLKLEDLNGTVTYSNVVQLQYSTNANIPNRINVYPNPTSGIVNLSISQTNGLNSNISALQTLGIVPGLVNNPTTVRQSYDIKIISITGSVIKTAKSLQPSWQGNLNGLMPGTYVIQVSNSNDKSLVGKSTFVKL